MKQSRFREIRDAFALDSMLKRKAQLEADSAGALAQARALRTKMRHTPKGQARDLVEADYDVKMAEWALFESLIGDIEHDPRYIAHRESQGENEG